MNLGHSIEDLVEQLCHRSFFADFTIKSPKYHKAGGLQKEAADLLVIFDETVLAIQIKSKRVSPSNEPSRVELNRVSKTIEQAVKQFRAFSEALNNPKFNSFVNGRGVEVSFEKSRIKEFIFIVIFVPVWELGGEEKPARIQFDTTCYPDGAIPVHLFSLEQFTMLLTMLDTLPDFLLYLTMRWTLHGERIIPQDSDPLDEWALAAFERKKLIEMVEKHVFTNLSGTFRRHHISVARLERQEKPGYFIDRLIESLYAAIGSSKISTDPKFKLLAEPNSLKAYSLTVPFFARLNRGERARFGEFLMNRLVDCEKQDLAFRGFKFQEQSPVAYLVFVARATRRERIIGLANIARGVGLKLNAKIVVGLTVAHDWPTSPACDVAYVDTSSLKPSENLVQMTDQLFGKTRHANR